MRINPMSLFLTRPVTVIFVYAHAKPRRLYYIIYAVLASAMGASGGWEYFLFSKQIYPPPFHILLYILI